MRESQSSSAHVRRIRSFIAVNLPVLTIQKVGELQRELRDRARQAGLKVGWVPLSSMHITLKFLAEIPEESVWAVRDLLKERLPERSGFRLHVRGTGAFPNRQRPRVLWVGVDCAGGELARLAGDVDGWLEEIGFAREKRPFSGHLTLGRVKAGSADVLGGTEQVDFGDCSVSEVVLYQSVLRRQGAEYQPLAHIALRPPPSRVEAAAVAAPAGAGPTQSELGEEEQTGPVEDVTEE
jgi:2'-5' RNA ligase